MNKWEVNILCDADDDALIGGSETDLQGRLRPSKNNKNELTEVYEEPDIIRAIGAGRLRWVGHVMTSDRQPRSRVIKMVWEQNPAGRRSLGRPRMRCRDNPQDPRANGIEYDPEMMQDREGWIIMMQSAKAHQRL
ncbi:hypothetical protein HUJ04_005365 [Dendroctonus ponderosae]|nr:hypothetical protein HUJ04_005365 [Dendroctonus ponderosae]